MAVTMNKNQKFTASVRATDANGVETQLADPIVWSANDLKLTPSADGSTCDVQASNTIGVVQLTATSGALSATLDVTIVSGGGTGGPAVKLEIVSGPVEDIIPGQTAASRLQFNQTGQFNQFGQPAYPQGPYAQGPGAQQFGVNQYGQPVQYDASGRPFYASNPLAHPLSSR